MPEDENDLYEKLKATLESKEQLKLLLDLDDFYSYEGIKNYNSGVQNGITLFALALDPNSPAALGQPRLH